MPRSISFLVCFLMLGCVPSSWAQASSKRIVQFEEYPGLPWNADFRYGQMQDARDGHVYRTIKIGEQTWMAQNLNFAGIDSASIGACYVNVPDSCARYGRLYAWVEVMAGAVLPAGSKRGIQGVCPAGWHVPADAEWTILQDAVESSGAFDGTRLKAARGWQRGGNGGDARGFRALPGGFRNPGGAFLNLGVMGSFWTASEVNAAYAWFRYMNNYQANVFRNNTYKASSHSMRCLQD